MQATRGAAELGQAQDALALGTEPGRGHGLIARFRDLARVAYRDPQHVSERLTLLFVERLGEPSREWAEAALKARGNEARWEIGAEQTHRAALVSRIDGVVAGTPFLVALVPAYVAHLWQEGVLVLRLAALYGHDPRGDRMAAEFLVLRQIHPTVEAADAALARVRATPMPDKPATRRPMRNWIDAVRMLGVFGGFLSAPTASRSRPHQRLRSAAGAVLGLALWAITWIFPLTFMLAMSWGCESDVRALGRRALKHYGADPEAARVLRPRGWRRILRAGVLALTLAVPIGFVAAADHTRQTTGFGATAAAGAVVALSLVIAMVVVARHG